MKLDVAGLSGAHYEMLLAMGAPLDEVLKLAGEALDLRCSPPPDSGEIPTQHCEPATQKCPACCPTVPSARGEVVEPVTVKTVPVTEACGVSTAAVAA